MSVAWMPLLELWPSQPAVTADVGGCQVNVFLADGVPSWEVFGGPRIPGCGRIKLMSSGQAETFENAKCMAVSAAVGG